MPETTSVDRTLSKPLTARPSRDEVVQLRPVVDTGTSQHVVIDPSILYLGTPVLLVSTCNADGSANLAPISSSWFLGTVGVLGLSTRSHTIENLRRTGEAVLNYPSVDLVDAVDRLAATTGSSPLPAYKEAMGFESVGDKFGRAGLTQQASDLVGPPRVLEAAIQLEVRVLGIHDVGAPHEYSAAISVQVVRAHVADSIRKPGHRHHIDPDRWRPLIMNFLEFYGLGAQVHRSRLAEVF
jgi:flavin reductase (DIM6/NTAB) family NADH-FMN oxidoreductase RutF